ncbi:mechanosensitive ion channel family protein [bacterium]|nr:mechanosensitive ion channel family protein [bacterium]
MQEAVNDAATIENITNKSFNSLSAFISEWIETPQYIQNILDFKIFSNSLADCLGAVLIFTLIYLFRIQFIKISEYFITKISKKFYPKLGHKFFRIFYKPLMWKILLIGFSASYSILEFSESTDKLYFTLNGSMNTLLISWALILLVDFVHESYIQLWDDGILDMRDTFVKLSVTIVKVIVVLVTFIVLLQTWGYNIGGLLASLGLVGMAIALAAKDSARHIFGSIMIFTDAPFKVGDWIHTPDVEGTIEDIGMRSTKVRTFAQALVSVPNGNLADSAILNWSKMDRRRIKLSLGVTYSTTSTQMQNILSDIRELLKNDADIDQTTIHVYFSDFAQSSLEIFCYFFTKTTVWGEHMQVKERIYLEFMKIIETNGASFAFPSQSIYIEQNESKSTENAV